MTEQETLDQINRASLNGPAFATVGEIRDFFGDSTWNRLLELLKDKYVTLVKWGEDDPTELIRAPKHLPDSREDYHDWVVIVFSKDGIIEVWPQGPGASGAGPATFNF